LQPQVPTTYGDVTALVASGLHALV
jgi:hypothetical protein